MPSKFTAEDIAILEKRPITERVASAFLALVDNGPIVDDEDMDDLIEELLSRSV